MKNKDSSRARFVGKLAILVPGESEYDVIPYLLNLLNVKISKPQSISGISYSEIKQQVIISSKVYREIEAAFKKNPSKVILVFDRESASLCPGDFAVKVKTKIEEDFHARRINAKPFSVICADHCIENWILANQAVFDSKLFKKDVSNRVKARADCLNSIDIISEGFGKNKHYDKTRHLIALVKHIKKIDDPMRKKSPSLDKFLRELGL